MSLQTQALRAFIRDGNAARGINATIHCKCAAARRQGLLAPNTHHADCRWRHAVDAIYSGERAEESDSA